MSRFRPPLPGKLLGTPARRLLLAIAACGAAPGCAGYGPPMYPPPGYAPAPVGPVLAPPGQVEAVPPGAAAAAAPYVPGAEPLPPGAPTYLPGALAPASSVTVPVLDRDLVWNQVVDVLDDYFKVAREQRVRQEGDVLIEGLLETYPSTSPTVFEPWRSDVATLDDRWENTLQSLRRQATLRVIPVAEGFSIEAEVHKELEDVERPEVAGVTAASLRNDNSVERYVTPQSGRRRTLGWIAQGRDVLLEQRILADIQMRLASAGPGLRY